MIKLYIRHVRQANYCSRGIRQFAKRYGFDFLDFARNGIDIAKLDHIDDFMLQESIKIAKAEAKMEDGPDG